MKSKLLLTVITLATLAVGQRAFAQLEAYWSFDSKTGTTVSDLSAGGTHDGTLVGGADITAGNMGFGGSGEALNLTGNGQHFAAGSPTTFDFNSSFTWHAYINSTDNSGAIFSRNPAGTAWNQGSKALFVRSDTVQWDTGWVGNPGTGTDAPDGNWHQLVATYEAGSDNLQIFVDGASVYNATHDVNRFDEHTHSHNGGFADTSFTVGEADFSGGLNNLDTLQGRIDEAAVFNTNLTGTELQQLFDEGPASFAPQTVVPEPASIAIWSLLALALGGFGYYRSRRRG